MNDTRTAHHLALKAVTLSFGNDITILRDISYRYEQGTSYALVGASGSGKSTLLQLLGGLAQPTAGAVWYDETCLTQKTAEEVRRWRRDTIGFVFQEPMLIPECTVAENVATKGLITGISYEECHREAVRLLEEVGLVHKAKSSPLNLSGGEQHRVSIARALFSRPAFLLLDEPTAHLDVTTKRHILELIHRIQTGYGMGMIVATHDPATADVMDRQLTLQDGLLREERSL